MKALDKDVKWLYDDEYVNMSEDEDMARNKLDKETGVRLAEFVQGIVAECLWTPNGLDVDGEPIVDVLIKEESLENRWQEYVYVGNEEEKEKGYKDGDGEEGVDGELVIMIRNRMVQRRMVKERKVAERAKMKILTRSLIRENMMKASEICSKEEDAEMLNN